jgi:multicopper oxidase
MHRRDLLKSVANTGLAVLTARVLDPISGHAADTETVDVNLTARPYHYFPISDVPFSGLAYNGQMPGPVLRVRYGQQLRVHFKNETGTDSTVHWHGMIPPNDMDGVPNVTQAPVPNGGNFIYQFTPNPPGLRWYHSHVPPQLALGLLGAIVVEDPREPAADVDVVLVFHDLPDMNTYRQALAGVSKAKMIAPLGSPELRSMGRSAMSPAMADMAAMGGTMGTAEMKGMNGMGGVMGDEVAYLARCINGATYPHNQPIAVKIGQLVRFRILNASPTLTRYIALAGHKLRVTHADGNELPRPIETDVLRLGVGERYDAWFEVTRPGAWLLQAIANDSLAVGQSVRIYTPGTDTAVLSSPPHSLDNLEFFTYERAGAAAVSGSLADVGPIDVRADFTLGHDTAETSRWTINGAVWPNTPKISVRPGDRVLVRFHNPTDMDHAMHLHGHVFQLIEVNGHWLANPLSKDTALVRSNAGTCSWLFRATSPPGRWVLHCHNSIHLANGMMTEVRYLD